MTRRSDFRFIGLIGLILSGCGPESMLLELNTLDGAYLVWAREQHPLPDYLRYLSPPYRSSSGASLHWMLDSGGVESTYLIDEEGNELHRYPGIVIRTATGLVTYTQECVPIRTMSCDRFMAEHIDMDDVDDVDDVDDIDQGDEAELAKGQEAEEDGQETGQAKKGGDNESVCTGTRVILRQENGDAVEVTQVVPNADEQDEKRDKFIIGDYLSTLTVLGSVGPFLFIRVTEEFDECIRGNMNIQILVWDMNEHKLVWHSDWDTSRLGQTKLDGESDLVAYALEHAPPAMGDIERQIHQLERAEHDEEELEYALTPERSPPDNFEDVKLTLTGLIPHYRDERLVLDYQISAFCSRSESFGGNGLYSCSVYIEAPSLPTALAPYAELPAGVSRFLRQHPELRLGGISPAREMSDD